MMNAGREMERLLKKGVDALERGAVAQEEILKLARAETMVVPNDPPGPPICPHCGMTNPTVSQVGAGGEGPLAEFVLAAECHNCQRVGYLVPEGWLAFRTTAEVAEHHHNGRAG